MKDTSSAPVVPAEFGRWPCFEDDEVAAIQSVLRSGRVNYWTGDQGHRFEEEFAAWAGARHAVALANGSVALELALRVMDVGAGDEVVVTSRSFVASASAIVLVGATPIFCDVELDSQNISARTIQAVLSPRTKAVICVHLAGWPCEIEPIRALCSDRGVALIEDCAQAHGARINGRSVGSLGDCAAWSFCQDKIMSTGGEGGMLTLDNSARWERAWSYKDHGKSLAKSRARGTGDGFRWLHDGIGTNWRLTEMQSAIGRIQLTKMPRWSAIRARNSAAILDACEETGIFRTPRPPKHIEHAWYKCYVFVRPERLAKGWSRDRIMRSISAAGVPCFSGSCPEIYMEQAFAGHGIAPRERLPHAQELGETSLMFLVHPTLSERAIRYTAEVIGRVAAEAKC